MNEPRNVPYRVGGCLHPAGSLCRQGPAGADVTLDRTPSDHSHTGNQVGCEHRIGKQDGPHSTDHIPPAVTLHGDHHSLRHDLPNGLRVTFSIGHIDRMPRCEVTGLAQSFCRHCDELNPLCHAGENDHD